MASVEVKVPDIGDFHDVPVIDVLVKPGDNVKPEDPLVTLESDKATMDVPSPAAGVVRTISVKIGDKVSQGVALLTLDEASGTRPSPTTQALRTPAASSAPSPQPVSDDGKASGAASPQPADSGRGTSSAPHAGEAASVSGHGDIECQMLVLGS